MFTTWDRLRVPCGVRLGRRGRVRHLGYGLHRARRGPERLSDRVQPALRRDHRPAGPVAFERVRAGLRHPRPAGPRVFEPRRGVLRTGGRCGLHLVPLLVQGHEHGGREPGDGPQHHLRPVGRAVRRAVHGRRNHPQPRDRGRRDFCGHVPRHRQPARHHQPPQRKLMKQPIRLTIAALLRDGKPRTARDVYEALRPQYPGERQLSPDAVDGHLQALKAVGIVLIAEETLEAGTLTQRYALSEYGKGRVERFL